MQARTALIAAILSATIAVGIVAADVAWGLEVHIDTQTEGGWETVASSPQGESHAYERFPHGCSGPDLRVRVDNDKPFGDTFDIRISYWDPVAERTQVVLDETWSLDAFEGRAHDFTIPDEAFPERNETEDPKLFGPHSLTIDVRVDEQFLGPCVQREAPQ